VFSERLDIFVLNDGTTAQIPAMGSFKVNEENLVTRWRDYFDLTDWNLQVGIDRNAGRGAGVLEIIVAEPARTP